ESLEPIHGFNLAYSLNGGPPVRQHFSETLASFGDSVMAEFDVYANMSRYGVYDLVIYSYNNNDECLANDTLRINIENISIDEPLLVKGNPFTEKLVIEINTEAESDVRARISLFDPQGRKLIDIEENIHPGTNEITISTDKLLPGVYYLKAEYPGWSKTVAVIKVRR
ncbi:MAG: T9SS type A sorting domain-containing protein, partial [Bacteroidales bacterium]|nr:T9SS type A sorting domain-containing protein [Bacteroidales bacterium]